jgi:uncharacterized membrane protein
VSAGSTRAELLAALPLFAALAEADRVALVDHLKVENARAGTRLFSRGDPGDSLFVIAKGRVEFFMKNDTGERVVFEEIGAGQMFGEISLLDGGARTASALVKEDLEALVLTRESLRQFLTLCPAAAVALLEASGRRMRQMTTMLTQTTSRNANVEERDHRTTVMKIADGIAEFSGSIPFIVLHAVVFLAWIVVNVPPLAAHLRPLGGFDPFPFGLLTMSVSLESIFLSVFLLLSQNRQAAREKVRNDVEYEVNVKAEQEIAHLHEKVDGMNERMLARLARIEQRMHT